MRSSWALIALCVALSACGQHSVPVADPAPAFRLQTIDGGWVSLEDLAGRYVLVDFWATWCAPCVLEVSELNAFYRDRGADVSVLAVSVDTEAPSVVARWAKEQGVLYPVAIGSESLAKQFGFFHFPSHLLLGPDGDVLERMMPGYHTREEFHALLQRHTPAGPEEHTL